ncbi:hypothetical protein LTR10_010203 [Elasticomyces elasticus]|nr:hypothetical protein LTR10_010203 [Elasticomyces elasticus]KAK4972107.1 hypothetical protein LTR42_006613 [Elasticomyces elasticus]
MFTHQPLDDARTQIRLVQIVPWQDGDDEEAISLTLVVRELKAEEDDDHVEGDGVDCFDEQWFEEDESRALVFGAGPGTNSRLETGSHVITSSDDQSEPGEGPIYTALSYMWGPPEPSRIILLDGQPFSIRLNLWQCLRVLRKQASPEVCYWIDQLCIDQARLVERAKQVQRMDQIYFCADHVLVWLGDHDYVDSLVLLAGRSVSRVYANSLDSISNAEEVLRVKLPEGILLSSALQKHDDPLEDVLDLERLEGDEVPLFKQSFQLAIREELHDYGLHEDTFLEQFARMRENPYWRRAWIIQESLLAYDLRILGPKHELPWPVFALFHEAVRSVDEDDERRNDRRRELYNGLFRILDIRAFNRGPCQRNGLPFSALMTSMPSAECADIRDRFYSILGLVPQEQPFEVDYTISARTLYFRVLDWLEPAESQLYVHAIAVLLDLDVTDIQEGISADEQRILELHRPSALPWTELEE